MKKLLIGLMLIMAWSALGAGALGTLQYRTNNYTLSPSNTMASNIYAGYGLTKLQGPGGAITLSNIWTTNTLASTNWVLEQIASLGTHIFASGVTNVSTLWDGAALRTNQWYGSNGAVLTITTNIVGVAVVNQYIRHVVSAQTFNRIGDGPIDVRAYIAKTAGAGTTQIHPEVYILFGTNLVELGSSVAQTISGATPIAYNWTITVGATNLASPCSVVWAWKVDSVGTASPQLEFVSGGIYDACLTLVENIASAQLDGSQIVSGTVDNSRLPGNVLTNGQTTLVTLNGGVTVTNAAAANGVQMTVGSTAYGVGSAVFSNSAGTMMIGVGKANPSYSLDIVGNERLTGNIVLNGQLSGAVSLTAASDGVLRFNDNNGLAMGCGILFGQAGNYSSTYYLSTNWPAIFVSGYSNNLTGFRLQHGTNIAAYADLTLGDLFANTATIATSNTTDIPLRVWTNGGVAVQVDAAGVATFNGSAVFRSNAVAAVNPVPNLAATNIGNVGVSGNLKVLGQIDSVGAVGSPSYISAYNGGVSLESGGIYLFSTRNIIRWQNSAGITGASMGIGGRSLTNAAASRVFSLPIAVNTSAGVTVQYTVGCSDGTNVQARSGLVEFDAINVLGTITTNIVDSADHTRALVNAGTLTVAWSAVPAANSIALWVTPTTSLGAAPTNFVGNYIIKCVAPGTLTAP